MKRFLSFILSLTIMVSAFPINALVVSADEVSEHATTSISKDSDKDNDIKSSDKKDAINVDDDKNDDIDKKDDKNDDKNDINENNDKKDDVDEADDIDKEDSDNKDDAFDDKKDDKNSEDSKNNSNNDKTDDKDIKDGELENEDVTDDNNDLGIDNSKKLEEAELTLEYALFAKSHNVKLGNPVGAEKSDIVSKVSLSSKTKLFPGELVLPKLPTFEEITEYEFLGWYFGTGNNDEDGEKMPDDYRMPNNQIWLIPHFKPIENQVAFDEEVTVKVGEVKKINIKNVDFFKLFEARSRDSKIAYAKEGGWLIGGYYFNLTGKQVGVTYVDVRKNGTNIVYKVNVVPADPIVVDAKYFVLLPDQSIENLGKEEPWQYAPNNKIKIGSWNANTGIPGSLFSLKNVKEAGPYGLRNYEEGFDSEYVKNPDEMGGFNYKGIYYNLEDYDILWYKIVDQRDGYHVDGYIKGQPVEVAYQWNGKTVKHHGDNGKIYSGDKITLASNDYTKFENPNNDFAGWKVIIGGEETVKQPGDEIVVMNSMVITPNWESTTVPIEKASVTYKYGDMEYIHHDGATVGEKYTVVDFDNAFPSVTLPQNKEFTGWNVISGSEAITDNLASDNSITVNDNSNQIILEAVIKEIPSHNVELTVEETKALTATVPFDTAEINGKTEEENNAVTLTYTSGNTFSITGAKEGTTQVVLKQDGKIVEIYNVTVIPKPIPAEIKVYYWVGFNDDKNVPSRYNDDLTPPKTSLFEGNKLVYEYKNVELTKDNISNLANDYLQELAKTHNIDGVEYSHYEVYQYPTDYNIYDNLYQGGGTIYISNRQPINNIDKISDVVLKGKTEIRLIFTGKAKNYTITYDSNLNGVDITNMPTEVEKVKGGANIVLPTNEPSANGYKFLGWYDEQGNKVTSESVMPSKDITLTAKFEKLSYLVSYKSIDIMDMQTALTGVTKLPTAKEATFAASINDIVKDVVPEKYGYNFLYWRYNGSAITNQTVPSNNIELVAHFERSLFNVNYSYEGVAQEDKDNIKNFPQNAKDVVKGTEITLDNQTLNGYHFLGWFDEQGNKVNKITVNKDYNLTAKFAKDATIEYVFYSLESGQPHKDTVVIDTDKTYEGAKYPVTAENIKTVAEKHLADNKINNFRYLGEFQVLKDGEPIYYSQDIENSQVKNFADLKLSAGKNTIYVLYDMAHNITVNYIQIDGETQTQLGNYQINDVFNQSEVALKDGYENNAGFISNNYLLADGYKLIKATLGDYENGTAVPNPFTMGKNDEVINVFYAKDDNQWKDINVQHIYNSDRNIETSTVSVSESKVINQNYEATPILTNNNVKYILSSVTVNGVNAQLVDGKIAGTITDNVNIVFTYDVDTNGDGVADKNQATFTFKSADDKMGKVAGEVIQIVTNESGKTFKVTGNVTTIVEAGYKFSNWTAEIQGETLTFANLDAIKASEFLGDITFTANFEAVLSGGGGSSRPHRPSRPSGNTTDDTTGGTPVEVIEIPDLPTPLEQNPVITTANPYIPSQQTTDVIFDIEDEDTPLTEKPEDNGDLELIEIEDETVPLTSSPVSGWALVNLIITVFTVLSSILLLFKNKSMFKTLSVFPAIGSVIAFILTENITNPMVITDKWTLMMCIIALIQVVVIALSLKGKKDEDTQSDAK